MHATVIGLFRYPVKGLAGTALSEAVLRPGHGIAGDRRFAVARGGGTLEPASFLGLRRHARLATLTAEFDDEAAVLTVSRKGRPVARGDVTAPAGRATLEQFFSAYLAKELNGPARLMDASAAHTLGATGTSGSQPSAHGTAVDGAALGFLDSPAQALAVLNLASVRDLERVVGARLDQRRFRPNIVIDMEPAWSELALIGQTLALGDATLRIEMRTERCAATNVNPDTAERDLNVPLALRRGFGHMDLGVYGAVIGAGVVRAD